MKIEKILRKYGYNCRYTKSTKKLTINLDNDKTIKGVINFMTTIMENESVKDYIHIKNITIKS